MVALDGSFYQVKMDGVAYPVKGGQQTLFAVVTQSDVDQDAVLPADLDCRDYSRNRTGSLPIGITFTPLVSLAVFVK